MKITFLGATRTVTGSNILIETKGKKILLDCGLYQGQQKEIELNIDKFLFEPSEIDFMILSHAHIDHSGRIPKLFASWATTFIGRIKLDKFCSISAHSFTCVLHFFLNRFPLATCQPVPHRHHITQTTLAHTLRDFVI